MAKMAIISETCMDITEVNGTQHEVTFSAFVVDSTVGYRGVVVCTCVLDAADNSNKVRDSYVDGVVNSCLALGITLARSDVISHQFYRAP